MATKRALSRKKSLSRSKSARKPKLRVVRSKTAKRRKLVVKKHTTARKRSVKRNPNRKINLNPIGKKQTKSEIIRTIATDAELPNADVKAVFEALKYHIHRHVSKRGSGEISIPEIGVKVRRVRKKATKPRMGRNPFTGQEMMIKAKPARDVIRVTALKVLKDVLK